MRYWWINRSHEMSGGQLGALKRDANNSRTPFNDHRHAHSCEDYVAMRDALVNRQSARYLGVDPSLRAILERHD
jgi:hypothetical protein